MFYKSIGKLTLIYYQKGVINAFRDVIGVSILHGFSKCA